MDVHVSKKVSFRSEWLGSLQEALGPKPNITYLLYLFLLRDIKPAIMGVLCKYHQDTSE